MSSQLQSFAWRAHEELFGNIVPFWAGPAVDHEQGGWMACLSNDLKPNRSRPKGLILHSRVLWTFSAVHRAKPKKQFRDMAQRAFDYLITRFWDAEQGGLFWRLDDNGNVIDDSKKIYGQAFCIYALSEFHLAFDVPQALDHARTLFQLIEQHSHDPRHGGYLEVCRRDWSEAGAEARLSDKDMNEKKSMNNHLHVLEAYTNLYRIHKNPDLEQRLRELIGLFEQFILDRRTSHFHHFFDEAWNVRSDTYTFGHDIEGSWLLCEAAEALGDPVLLERVRSLALRMAYVTLKEGLDDDGALCYEGRAGQIIDAGKEWWPAAEAVVGFLNAYQLSNNPQFLQASRRTFDFIEQTLVDRRHGDWFWRINPDGHPDPNLPKVNEWKCPYHSGRMCLEVIHRLDNQPD